MGGWCFEICHDTTFLCSPFYNMYFVTLHHMTDLTFLSSTHLKCLFAGWTWSYEILGPNSGTSSLWIQQQSIYHFQIECLIDISGYWRWKFCHWPCDHCDLVASWGWSHNKKSMQEVGSDHFRVERNFLLLMRRRITSKSKVRELLIDGGWY